MPPRQVLFGQQILRNGKAFSYCRDIAAQWHLPLWRWPTLSAHPISRPDSAALVSRLLDREQVHISEIFMRSWYKQRLRETTELDHTVGRETLFGETNLLSCFSGGRGAENSGQWGSLVSFTGTVSKGRRGAGQSSLGFKGFELLQAV